MILKMMVSSISRDYKGMKLVPIIVFYKHMRPHVGRVEVSCFFHRKMKDK